MTAVDAIMNISIQASDLLNGFVLWPVVITYTPATVFQLVFTPKVENEKWGLMMHPTVVKDTDIAYTNSK